MHLHSRLAVVALTLISAPFLPGAEGEETLWGFKIGPKNPSDGELTLHPDGNFYGTSTGGGATDAGTIFRLTREGALDWLSLSEGRGSAPGKSPEAGMIRSSDGWMWGTARTGGIAAANGIGGIFRYKPENNEHQLVVGFGNSGSTHILGKNPVEGLSADGTGWMWGAAPGGFNDNGVVYKVHEATGVFEAVIGTTTRPWTTSSGLVKGRNPITLYAHPGSNYVWGLTGAGGIPGGNAGGTVFRIDRSTNPHGFITVGEFSRDANAVAPVAHASGPTGKLAPDGLGFLWGAASDDANISPSPNFGSLFKVDMAGTTTAATTVPVRFTGTGGATPGNDPLGHLVKDTNGLLWGVTRKGGAADKGTIFALNPTTGTMSTHIQIGALTGANAVISNPLNPLTPDGDGYLWGLAQAPGNTGPWTFYKVEIATGTVTLVKAFPAVDLTRDGKTPSGGVTGKAGSPWLYGTTAAGGEFGFGTLFRYNLSTKALETLVNFTGNSGAAMGDNAQDRLHIHTDGTVWGITRDGGTGGFGTVFKFDPGTLTFTHLASFTAGNGTYKGADPAGKLTTGGDGFIWGSTVVGNDGSIFKINPATNVVTIVKTLTGANSPDGARPTGLVADSNGILWGTMARGGGVPGSATGYGTIFKIDPVTGTFSNVLLFTGSSGTNPGQTPTGNPVFGSDGKLWGQLASGVFKYDTVTGVITIVPLTESATFPPELPFGGPGYYVHTDGFKYGTLTAGGRTSDGTPAGGGVIFRLVEGWPSGSAGTFSEPPYPEPVTLSGGISNAGGSSYQFEWGSSTALGQKTPLKSGQTSFTETLYLSGETTYYYRTRINTPNGPVYSPISSLITRRINPGVNAEILVESPLGQPLVDNVTLVNLGALQVGEQVRQPVIIRNVGQAQLTGLTATIGGANPEKFIITTALGSTSLSGPGDLAPVSTYVYVTYTPGAEGTHTATLTITSNDSNETPFEVLLTGSGVIDPDIQVEQPADTVLASDGSSTVNFGGSGVGTTAGNVTFAVKNVGLGTLNNVSVSLTGPNAGDFSLSTVPGTSIASNGSGNLVVGFTPSGNGTRTASLVITSNDPDEPAYQIALTGTGTGSPEIVFEYPAGTNVNSGGSVAFGTTPQGVSLTRTFTLRNTGNAPLTVSAAIQGQPQYQITMPPPGTIAAGASATFQVTLTPLSMLPVIATMRLITNDSDEGTFDVILNGSGASATAPELVVEQPVSTNLNNGASVSFGSVNVGSSSALTFTVRNTGNAALTLAAAMVGSSDYTVTTAPTGPVAANGSTTFIVTLTPSAAGTLTGTLRLTTNDTDESIFDLLLTGTAAIAQNPAFPPAGQPASRIVLAGETTHFSPVVTGAEPRTYQWRKNGKNLAGAPAKLLEYSLPGVKATDAGGYSLVVSNDIPPSATSPVFFLGVITPLPSTLQVNEGGTLTLACTASAPPGHTIAYQWTRNGNPLLSQPSATTKTLKITAMAPGDGGTYACIVTMQAGSAAPFISTSNGCAVTVLAKPVLSAIATPAPMLVSETVNISPLTTVGGVSATFAAKGLPPGVKLDPNTGIFSGKPTAAKSYTLVFTAKNAAGTSDPVSVTWVVEPLADEALVGTFNGLVERDAFTNFGLGGVVQLTTATTGAVSGSITLAGAKYSVTGVLDTSSGDDTSATLVAKRTPALGNLVVDLTIENNANRMTGTIRDPQFDTFVSDGFAGDGTAGFGGSTRGTAKFNSPRGIASVLATGYYVADTGNHIIRFIGVDDQVSTVAGTLGIAGNTNANGVAASFNGPEGILYNFGNGDLYIADTGNHIIRKITNQGVVTTFAGSGADGGANGTGMAASFSSPSALAFDPVGNVIVVDRGNHTLRKITPAGVVTTLAGKAGVAGHKDGGGAAALFNTPRGITYDSALKAFFVTDTGNRVVRKVTATGAVTTYAGSPGVEGSANGVSLNARFIEPVAITSNGAGTLYVADTLLVRITPGGLVGTVTDFVDEVNRSDHPVAIDFDHYDGSVIAADDVLHGVTSHKGAQPAERASFTAWRNTWTTAAPPATGLVASYTAGIETGESGTEFPLGDGYATLSISKTGAAKWAGKTGDGTAFTFATVLSPNKDVILHSMLYKNTGSIQGLVAINQTTGDLNSVTGPDAPAFDWYKLSQPLVSKDRLYKAGFITHPLTLVGGKYAPANNLYVFLAAASGAPTINILSPVSPFDLPLTLTAPNKVVVPTTNGMKLSIAAATGLYTGSFTEGTPARKATVAGVLVNNVVGNIRRGYGHFTLPTTTVATSPIISGKARIEKAQ